MLAEYQSFEINLLTLWKFENIYPRTNQAWFTTTVFNKMLEIKHFFGMSLTSTITETAINCSD